ncbi:MAG: hypothetical protein LLF76_14805 [Planctomycetaceae bacterium]|nr:hypothetical protein [Planctomycetaceae bacterium]
MQILILTDYRNAFYSSTRNARTLSTLDVAAIRTEFEKRGYQTAIKKFSEVDFSQSYAGTYVLYTSSEDRGLKYKSYIEDLILFLKEKGATVIPDYPFLRAHHNKSFMEMLRYQLFPQQARLLNTKICGTVEDLKAADLTEQQYVIKSAYGAGSKHVKSAAGKQYLIGIAEKMSRCFDLEDIASEYRRRIFWPKYKNGSLHRNKFIIQNFIEGLKGDFKVLRYGRRFYRLYRENRPDDFRASGGGRLNFALPDSVDENRLLSFAKESSDRIGTPLCSMDIAWNGTGFILLEFQCLCFGPYTAERSDHYTVYEEGQWKKIYEKCNIEDVLSEAIHQYIHQIQKV